MCFPTEVSEAVIISSFPDLCVLGHKIQVVTCLLPDVGYHIMCSTGEKYAQNHRFLRTSVTYSRNNIPGVHHAEAVTAGCCLFTYAHSMDNSSTSCTLLDPASLPTY